MTPRLDLIKTLSGIIIIQFICLRRKKKMTQESLPLIGSNAEQHFYSGKANSIDESGLIGTFRRLFHGLTIISIITTIVCTIYGSVHSQSGVFILPLIVVCMSLGIHLTLFYFSRQQKHDFHPPGWFIILSNGQVVLQAIVVVVLTPFH